MKTLTIQWVSQVLTYVPTAAKYADVNSDLASRTLMHKQPVLIRPGSSYATKTKQALFFSTRKKQTDRFGALVFFFKV